MEEQDTGGMFAPGWSGFVKPAEAVLVSGAADIVGMLHFNPLLGVSTH